jgi:hypothetical protein
MAPLTLPTASSTETIRPQNVRRRSVLMWAHISLCLASLWRGEWGAVNVNMRKRGVERGVL